MKNPADCTDFHGLYRFWVTEIRVNPCNPMFFVKGKDNFSQKSFPRQLPARYALNANLAGSFPAVSGF
ncbi:MAG: hypothetical protein LBD55_09315, partial [Treponema sp.]|nr:hypothetical protein [Treponema sp.]